MLKVLESADRTTVFHVLIKFLRYYAHSMLLDVCIQCCCTHLVVSCSTGVAELSDKRSFLDLTIKCLIKMVKLLPGTPASSFKPSSFLPTHPWSLACPDSVDRLNLVIILRDCHDFFTDSAVHVGKSQS